MIDQILPYSLPYSYWCSDILDVPFCFAFSPFFSSSELFNKDTSWYHVYTCNYETVQNYKVDFTWKVFSLCLGCGICSDFVVYTFIADHFVGFHFILVHFMLRIAATRNSKSSKSGGMVDVGITVKWTLNLTNRLRDHKRNLKTGTSRSRSFFIKAVIWIL